MSFKLPLIVHHLGKASYAQVLAQQEAAVTKLVERSKIITQLQFEASKNHHHQSSMTTMIPPIHDADHPIQIFIVEHDAPTYTMGKRDTTSGIRSKDDVENQNIFHLKRGGGLTYHGPGQLTVYPILHIPTLHKIAPTETKSSKQGALHWYTCLLEKTMMMTLRDFGVFPTFAGNTGVWVPNNFLELQEKQQQKEEEEEEMKKSSTKKNQESKWEAASCKLNFSGPASRTSAPEKADKIGFIGLDFRQNCVMHGIALNIGLETLEPFKKIVICEMENAKTTCLEECLRRSKSEIPSVAQVGNRVIENFLDLTGLKN